MDAGQYFLSTTSVPHCLLPTYPTTMHLLQSPLPGRDLASPLADVFALEAVRSKSPLSTHLFSGWGPLRWSPNQWWSQTLKAILPLSWPNSFNPRWLFKMTTLPFTNYYSILIKLQLGRGGVGAQGLKPFPEMAASIQSSWLSPDCFVSDPASC